MKLCPCGNPKRYLDCCGAALQKNIPAETPEALMRSRYTAFVERKFDYIQKTMRPPASLKFNKKEAKKDHPEWLGLTVIHSSIDNDNNQLGYVEFKAHYKNIGKIFCIHEKSIFHCIEGRWYYVDGERVSA